MALSTSIRSVRETTSKEGIGNNLLRAVKIDEPGAISMEIIHDVQVH
jgi:hypothetical protein